LVLGILGSFGGSALFMDTVDSGYLYLRRHGLFERSYLRRASFGSIGSTKMSVADEIKAIMDEKGVTAYKVNKDVGIDQGALSRFFAGARGLSAKNLAALLDYLGYELGVRKKRK
jgi:hypothetical protein